MGHRRTAARRAAVGGVRRGAGRGARPGDRPGHHAIHYASQGYSATGIDSSPAGIERAKRNAQRAAISVNLQVADSSSAPSCRRSTRRPSSPTGMPTPAPGSGSRSTTRRHSSCPVSATYLRATHLPTRQHPAHPHPPRSSRPCGPHPAVPHLQPTGVPVGSVPGHTILATGHRVRADLRRLRQRVTVWCCRASPLSDSTRRGGCCSRAGQHLAVSPRRDCAVAIDEDSVRREITSR